MSLATHSPLSPTLPDAIMQVSGESEQNPSVSSLNCLPLASFLTDARLKMVQVSLRMPRTYSSLVAFL